MKRSGLACVLLATAAAAGCHGSDPLAPPPPTPPARLDLRVAAGVDQLAPVGVTVDAAGTRFFLDENAGLFRLDADGRATLVLAMADLPQADEPVAPPFTDLVAVAPDQFALTAIGDGFLLDVAANTMTQHFCYLPGETPAWLWQRTDALAYDVEADRLLAQPRTYDMENVLQATQVAAYERVSGLDVEWQTLPLGAIDAGAMVVLPGGRVFLAEGSVVYALDRERQDVTPVVDFGGEGLGRIEGLAHDRATDTLLVLDGATDSLYTIPAADL